MVNLKYIENPFTDDYLYSFYCFQEEKIFYDCVEDRILISDEAFYNLQSSFYTFLLTGNSEEWLGYVMFYNHELVSGYVNTVQLELERLLLKLKNIIDNNNVDRLLNDLRIGKFSGTRNLSLLEQELSYLKGRAVSEDDKTLSYFEEYYTNILDYLSNFKEYYYLDMVIALPLGTKKDDIRMYSGFINETKTITDDLINNKFDDIPILKSNGELYLEKQKVKILKRKDIA